MDITLKQQQLIKDHTLKCYPNEMCGVLTDTDFIPLQNCSIEPEKSFSFDPVDYAKLTNVTTAIVHSHCKKPEQFDLYDLRTPSPADIKSQKRSNKPWLIVGCEGMVVSDPIEIPRTPSSQYTGRRFMWFVSDCYTLVRDYYHFELGIDLPDHHPDFDWTNEAAIPHAFDPYINDYGFIDIETTDDMHNGDLLLLNANGLQFNHLGVYHNGEVIHQDGISRSVPFGHYIGRINRILRYAH